VPKDLHSLIRLHDWQVEEKQRALADLLAAVMALETRARNLEEELLNEQKVAAAAPAEIALYYGAFAKAAIARRKVLAKAIADAEAEAAAARDRLREAYRELKKYAVAQEHRDIRETAERDRKEQIFLDELGIQAFLRKSRRPPARRG